MAFRDRTDAGRRLAFALRRYRDAAPVVLALPRGGVPVGAEIARALSAPLDVWVVRKIGAPGHEELGLGAVAEGGEVYLNESLMAELGVTDDEVAGIVHREAAEVLARVRRFRGDRPPPTLEDRTVIVTDDGIATGGTVRAAVRAIRKRRPRRLVLAVPVASASTLDSLRDEVDEEVCLDADPYLTAIGAYYDDFEQTTDAEVLDLLALARAREGADAGGKGGGPRVAEHIVAIELDGIELEGSLAIPERAAGLVLFAHGSGSSRRSPRNRRVAEALQRAGLATLLFDLLTVPEEADDQLRFDVELLATRVLAAAEATRVAPETRALHLGYFGASTGAAAALIAAAERPDLAAAVVSRGGRPDLVGAHLAQVTAPTLLLVGSLDTDVLALNEAALEQLGGPRQLTVVPGATHLFEEPGALDEVARLAAVWFARYLGQQPMEESA